MGLPLLARENSVVPVGAEDSRPDYDLAGDVTFHVFSLSDGVFLRVEVPDAGGEPATVIKISREGMAVTVEPERAAGSWKVLLRSMGTVASVEGGSRSDDRLGALVEPDAPDKPLTITLSRLR